MSDTREQLIKNSLNPQFIREVFKFAENIYGEKKWLSGQDFYIDHVTRMALILQKINIDETTIAAALLYGIADTTLSDSMNDSVADQVAVKFGDEIYGLIKKTSQLNKIYYSFRVKIKDLKLFTEEKNEKLRKMFFALAGDIRIILIKIASRIDGLQRFQYISDESKAIYATETLQIFVPVANRLGLGEIKRQLEDLAFEYLYPEKFKWLRDQLKEKYEQGQKELVNFIPKLKAILADEEINFLKVDHRVKSYWSSYQKLERHAMNFEKLHDLVAVRIIVLDVEACYKTLGIIHKHLAPMSGQIQDYIAKPKENGYKSLHTTVFLEPEKICEIQIKTEQMNKDAEHGICAHWAYKEKISQIQEENLKWSEKIPDFFKNFKIDFFQDQIFSFTPQGDVIVLPKDSTSVDFAYALHSQVGDHCEGAKVNGKIISLDQPIKNGDVVEIIINKKRLPSLDWLKFVKTGFAKVRIKKIIDITFKPILSVPGFIRKQIARVSKKSQKIEKDFEKIKGPEIYIAGQKNIAFSFAKCCNPEAGDQVKAYLAQNRPAIVHRISCQNFQKVAKKFPEKVIDADWK